MTRKKKSVPTLSALSRPKELLERLVPGPLTPEATQDLFMSFKKAVIECVIGAELGLHSGSDDGAIHADGGCNHGNGRGRKTVSVDTGPLQIDTPRDCAGSFESQLIGKHEWRLAGFAQQGRLRARLNPDNGGVLPDGGYRLEPRAAIFGSSPNSGESCTDFEEETGVASVSVSDVLDDLDLVVDPLDQIRSEGPSAMSQDAWQIGL